MGEVLLHPMCKQMAAEVRTALVHKLLGALDLAISAIEGSAAVVCSADLDDIARICRATRNHLSTPDQKSFHASPACLDVLMALMQQVQALLVVLQKYLVDKNALIRSTITTTLSEIESGST